MSFAGSGWVLDEPQGDYPISVDVDAERLGAFLSALHPIVDEARVAVGGGGLETSATGSANVCAVDATLSPCALEDVKGVGTGVSVGWNVSKLLDVGLPDGGVEALGGEPLHVELDENVTRVSRCIGDGADVGVEVGNIDPDAVRAGTDPDWGHGAWEATVPARPFVLAVEAVCETAHEKVVAAEGSGALVLVSDGEASASVAEFEDVAEARGEDAGAGDSSAFEPKHLRRVAEGVDECGANEVTVRWGDDWPLTVSFDRRAPSGEPVLHGRFVVAPRVSTDTAVEWAGGDA